MALTILNNIAAIAAQNQLNITSNSLNSTLEQLSSGSRINSGADDPAGLAIANGLEANIAALTQSASNATDGVGELQVADGALSQVTTLLDRAVTLATESATGTVSNSQRTAIDTEFQSIKAEIDSIGSTTNFNGGQVFTANTLNVFLSDGSTSGSSTIGVTTGLLSSAGLNLGGAVAAAGTLTEAAGTAAVAATNTLTGVVFTPATAGTTTLTTTADFAAGDTVTIGTNVYTFVATAGALTAANDVLLVAGNATASLQNLAAAVNAQSGGAGVTYAAGTTANAAVSAGTAAGNATVATLVLTANLNGTADNTTATSVTGGHASFPGATLASGTAGVAGATVTVGGQTYTFVTALSATPTANEVVTGGTEALALSNLVLAVNGGTGAGTNYSTGTVQNANVQAAATTGFVGTKDTFTANVAGAGGDFITASAAGTTTGTWTGANFAGGANAGTPPIATAGDTVTTGGQTYTFVNALSTTPVANQILVEATDAASLSNLANAVNGGTGLGATYSTGTVANTNVTAAVGSTAAGLQTVTFTSAVKGLAGNAIATSSTSLQTLNPNTFAGSELTGGTAGSVNDLLTQGDAQTALTLINNAVATIAALRGDIGSTVNRLQSASSVINNQTQNLTSAENDVTAANIPTVVANLSSYSILEQTGISAIAQANQQQQLVLKLLQ